MQVDSGCFSQGRADDYRKRMLLTLLMGCLPEDFGTVQTLQRAVALAPVDTFVLGSGTGVSEKDVAAPIGSSSAIVAIECAQVTAGTSSFSVSAQLSRDDVQSLDPGKDVSPAMLDHLMAQLLQTSCQTTRVDGVASGVDVSRPTVSYVAAARIARIVEAQRRAPTAADVLEASIQIALSDQLDVHQRLPDLVLLPLTMDGDGCQLRPYWFLVVWRPHLDVVYVYDACVAPRRRISHPGSPVRGRTRPISTVVVAASGLINAIATALKQQPPMVQDAACHGVPDSVDSGVLVYSMMEYCVQKASHPSFFDMHPLAPTDLATMRARLQAAVASAASVHRPPCNLIST